MSLPSTSKLGSLVYLQYFLLGFQYFSSDDML